MSLEPNLANIRAWVEALESGDYEQTRTMLRRLDEGGHPKYCCLGVATHLAAQAGVDIVPDDGHCSLELDDIVDPDHWHDFWCQLVNEVLPIEVQEWLGIDAEDPVLYVRGFDEPAQCTSGASIYNDKYQETFAQIAWRVRRIYLPEQEWTPHPGPHAQNRKEKL